MYKRQRANGGSGKIWLAASHWRPHKRLKQNIDLFYSLSGKNDILLIAGKNPDVQFDNLERVFYLGDLRWENLISVMKVSDFFIHLAWLDHCPNVVVDAKAAGCKIFCTDAGGTDELADKNDVVFLEKEWDFNPVDLYSPPVIDFSKTRTGICTSDYSIVLSLIHI